MGRRRLSGQAPSLAGVGHPPTVQRRICDQIAGGGHQMLAWRSARPNREHLREPLRPAGSWLPTSRSSFVARRTGHRLREWTIGVARASRLPGGRHERPATRGHECLKSTRRATAPASSPMPPSPTTTDRSPTSRSGRSSRSPNAPEQPPNRPSTRGDHVRLRRSLRTGIEPHAQHRVELRPERLVLEHREQRAAASSGRWSMGLDAFTRGQNGRDRAGRLVWYAPTLRSSPPPTSVRIDLVPHRPRLRCQLRYAPRRPASDRSPCSSQFLDWNPVAPLREFNGRQRERVSAIRYPRPPARSRTRARRQAVENLDGR